jgi:hypothetical protein
VRSTRRASGIGTLAEGRRARRRKGRAISILRIGFRRTNRWRCALETMIGIAALLVGAGIGWLCFAIGVYFFTRTGREGMRIARMEDERRQRPSPEE